jgi:hypothetical protein
MERTTIMNDSTPVVVASLICEAHRDLCLQSFRGLLQYSAEPVQLHLFEDGSLTSETAEALRAALPGVRIWYFRDYDGPTRQWLARMPNLRNFRALTPMGLKIFDIPLHMYKEIGRFFYIDSDVLYYQRFSWEALRQLPADAVLFARDSQMAYSIGWREWLKWRTRLPLPFAANLGFYNYPPQRYNLEYLEWVYSEPDFWRYWTVIEQLAWAAMSRGENVYYVDPRQLVQACPGYTMSERTVIVHYPDVYKKKMRQQSDRLPAGVPAAGSPPVVLSPEIAPQVTFLRYAQNVLHRRRLMRLAATDPVHQSP